MGLSLVGLELFSEMPESSDYQGIDPWGVEEDPLR